MGGGCQPPPPRVCPARASDQSSRSGRVLVRFRSSSVVGSVIGCGSEIPADINGILAAADEAAAFPRLVFTPI